MAEVRFTVNFKGGSGDYDPTTGVSPTKAYATRTGPTNGKYDLAWYSNSARTVRIVSVAVPKHECMEFAGYWTKATGGVMLFDKYGYAVEQFSSSVSANYAYAHWIRVSNPLTLDDFDSTDEYEGTHRDIYRSVDGGWFNDDQCTLSIDRVPPPTRAGYRFLGYFGGSEGDTMYIGPDGVFTTAMAGLAPDSDDDDVDILCAHWARISTISVDADGGSGGTAVFYYCDGTCYADELATQPITSITLPIKASSVCLGLYDGFGHCFVAADGAIINIDQLHAMAAANDPLWIDAHWRTVVGVEFDRRQGVFGSEGLTYDSADGQYRILGAPESATAIDIPVRECHRFLGYYTAADGGTQCIDASGALLTALTSLSPSASFTLYAHWELCSHKLTLDPGEGTSDILSIYCDGTENRYYADDQLESEITSVGVPVLTGRAFGGYGGDIDSSGAIVRTEPFTANATVSAVWTPRTYSVFFNYSIGHGDVGSKSVTWGEAIGDLPTANHPSGSEYTFSGWTLAGRIITADTVWDYDAPGGSVSLVAAWIDPTTQLTDYFGLAGPLLVCISSSDGATRTVLETGPGGKLDIRSGDSSVGAHRVYGKILNPTNTYRVIGRGSVLLTMGRAYGMATLDASATEGGVRHPVAVQSGYMLVGWKLKTAPDGVPTLEVFGMGNEGYKCASSGQTATAQLTPAINTYAVEIQLDPDHVAQDPFLAVNGGGELVSCVTEGRCDAVVPLEYGMPCASDICHGKIVVTASTAAYQGESAPSARTPFVEVQPAESREENDFTMYGLVAERSL